MDIERKRGEVDSEFESCIEHEFAPDLPLVASVDNLKDLLATQPIKYV